MNPTVTKWIMRVSAVLFVAALLSDTAAGVAAVIAMSALLIWAFSFGGLFVWEVVIKRR